MAKQIALPDGSVGEFPDDMSDDDIAGVLRKQYPPPVDPQAYVAGMPAPRTPEQQNALTFGAGAQHAMDRAALGVKGLLPESVQQGGDQAEAWLRAKLGMAPAPNLPQQVREGQAYLADKGWRGTAGQMAGDVAMSAAPMGAAGQALGVAGRFLPSTLARLAPAVGDVAANAGYAAATNPEDRGMAALAGGVGAAAGRALPGVVDRVRAPFGRPGPEAQAMIDAGVTPTLGQVMGEKSGMLPQAISNLERRAQYTPVIGAPIQEARNRAVTQLEQLTGNETALQKSLVHGVPRATRGRAAIAGRGIGTGGVTLAAMASGNLPHVVGAWLLGKGYSTEFAQKYLTGQLAPLQAQEVNVAVQQFLSQFGREAGTQASEQEEP